MIRAAVILFLFYIIAVVNGQDNGKCVFFPGTGFRALHRSYPIGSSIQVYANGRSVVVTITGRGAFSGDVILELSYDAFAVLADPALGIINCGFLMFG